LRLLEQFSLCSDGRRDYDLGFLKLSEVRSPDVTHASSNSTYQILASIIYLGRPEQNLP